MSNLLFQTIDQISREKGIDPQVVIHAIEDAIVVASRKHFRSNEELRSRINPALLVLGGALVGVFAFFRP